MNDRVFVFPGPRLPALALAPAPDLNLYFPAPASNLYLPALVLNFCLPLPRFTVKICYSYSVYLYNFSVYLYVVASWVKCGNK